MLRRYVQSVPQADAPGGTEAVEILIEETCFWSVVRVFS
jgi:hypothetical protein